MANLFDNFYKKYKFAQMRRSRDLEAEYVADPISDNDIKSLGDFESLAYYSAGARSVLKFFTAAGLVMNYKSLEEYSRSLYARLSAIPDSKTKNSFTETVKENKPLVAYNQQRNIEFQFDQGYESLVADVADIAQDLNRMDVALNGSAADDIVGNPVSTNAMLKGHANIGNPDDSGLNDVEKYFIFPDFYNAWLEKAQLILSNLNLSKKTGGLERKKEEVDRLKGVVDRILSKISSAKVKSDAAFKNKEEYLGIIYRFKTANFNNFNKKVSKSQETINKQTNIRMADKSINSYYKDALKGSDSDPLMKQFYSGMKDFYGEKTPHNDSRKSKDLMDFFLEESDLTSDSHKEDVILSKSLGEGGLVENGHQSKEKHVDVTRRFPSGNFKNN